MCPKNANINIIIIIIINNNNNNNIIIIIIILYYGLNLLLGKDNFNSNSVLFSVVSKIPVYNYRRQREMKVKPQNLNKTQVSNVLHTCSNENQAYTCTCTSSNYKVDNAHSIRVIHSHALFTINARPLFYYNLHVHVMTDLQKQ